MKCLYCDKEFEPRSSSQRYCSEDCKRVRYNESRRKKHKTVPCRNCNKEFLQKAYTQVYCSPACKAEYEAANKTAGSETHCRYCGKTFIITAERKRFCSDECREAGRGPLTPDQKIKREELQRIERRVREEVGRTRILAELLEEAVTRVNKSQIKPIKPRHKPKRDPETMVVLRSDLHPGLITPSYDLSQFHRRMELFTDT